MFRVSGGRFCVVIGMDSGRILSHVSCACNCLVLTVFRVSGGRFCVVIGMDSGCILSFVSCACNCLG